MGKWMGLFLKKNHLLKWDTEVDFLLNWIRALTLSLLLKTTFKKIGALNHSMTFLSPEVVLYFYKSNIQPYMEFCGHVWAGAPSCFLELLNKLQKQICRTTGLSLATSIETLAHCRNVASLHLSYGYNLGGCSSDLAQLVPLLYFQGRPTSFQIDCMNFLSPFLDLTSMCMSTVSFLRQLDSGILCL